VVVLSRVLWCVAAAMSGRVSLNQTWRQNRHRQPNYVTRNSGEWRLSWLHNVLKTVDWVVWRKGYIVWMIHVLLAV